MFKSIANSAKSMFGWNESQYDAINPKQNESVATLFCLMTRP